MAARALSGMMFAGAPATLARPESVIDATPLRQAPAIDLIKPDLANSTVNKPGFFSKGGGWVDVIGNMADTLAGRPIYQTAMRQRQDRDYEAQQLQARHAQQQSDWLQQQIWKQQHPDDQFTQYLTAAGIDPRSPEGQQLYRQRAETMATPPTVAVDGFDAQGNQTKTFMPRAGIGGGQSAGPPVGTIRKGFRFTGGNYKDRNSWVPVGGAPSAGGVTFP